MIDEFREGRFDYLELASDVAETKFFQFLFGQGLVDQLARHYPSPRKRHHVPLGMYVSSQLALRLHGSHSFHSYPLIIRAGGLIAALGPEVATRKVDPQTGDMSIHCAGFNTRNLHPRATPCDQDYLRKLAKDTDPKKLEQWYNHHVAQLYGQLNAYDEEGIFIGDGSYLFVPNNKNYEGSKRLLFDEHNHPVSKEEEKKMTPAQRQRCQWHRCYRAVFLLHCDRSGERFVIAGLRVLRADQAEGPALWELLDTFVGAVGRGVLKVLLVDRGFIDGPQIGRLKTEHGVDTVIPIRKNMDILQDVRGIVKLGVRWEEYQRPRREPLTPPRPKHPTAAKREKTRQKTLAKKRAEALRDNPPAPSDVLERTLITKVPELTSWSDCPVPLTGVYSKDCYADGHEKDWLLVTTNPDSTAAGVRDYYAMRTDIEELHRQVAKQAADRFPDCVSFAQAVLGLSGSTRRIATAVATTPDATSSAGVASTRLEPSPAVRAGIPATQALHPAAAPGAGPQEQVAERPPRSQSRGRKSAVRTIVFLTLIGAGISTLLIVINHRSTNREVAADSQAATNSPPPAESAPAEDTRGEAKPAEGARPAAPAEAAPADLATVEDDDYVPKPVKVFPTITNSIGSTLALIPAGEFLMGSPDSDSEATDREKPQHPVRITKPFYLGVFEVTQADYQKVTGGNPSLCTNGSVFRPVEFVSWEDATTFCRLLSEMPAERAAGRTYRLPTEAEWEYACRAGSETIYPFGDSAGQLADYAWFSENSESMTHPVGQKQPNAWGLYDMLGNVWEGCADRYGSYESASADDPSGARSGVNRVLRGGSCDDFGRLCRPGYRHGYNPAERNFWGFRLAPDRSTERVQ